MLNEWIKQLYSKGCQVASTLASKKTKKEIVYLLSFPNNDQGLISQLSAIKGIDALTICYTKNCFAEAQKYQEQGMTILPLDNLYLLYVKIIPLITQVKVVICDNYFALLGDLSEKRHSTIYQIWHANGAIKTFGWGDKKTVKRSKRDQARFQRVYNSFDQIVVGSDKMAEIFKESYQLKDSKISRIGVPRTDVLFSQDKINAQRKMFQQAFPEAQKKRVVLYVPTYRDQETESLEFKRLINETTDVLYLYKFHPHTKLTVPETSEGISDLRGLSLENVLSSVDVLITDYSSIPFEYSLVQPKGKILFYCYDLEDYTQSIGIQDDFLSWAAQGLVTNEVELIQALQTNQGLVADVLNQSWNKYNDGHSTERLLLKIQKRIQE